MSIVIPILIASIAFISLIWFITIVNLGNKIK